MGPVAMFGLFQLGQLFLVGKVQVQLVCYLPVETRVATLPFTQPTDLVRLPLYVLQLLLEMPIW